MLKLFEIPLQLPEGERIHSSMGSIFHGALMELLPSELVEYLHEQNLRPFSQSVFFDRNKGPVWRIGVMSDVVENAFLFGLAEGETLRLQQKGYEIRLGEVRCVQQSSFEELAEQAFTAEETAQNMEMTFLTPTSFKRDGQYVLFPETRLILQSLLMRWNSLCPDIQLQEENLAGKLADKMPIVRYHLHSSAFSLERQRIHGFQGNLSFHSYGPDSVQRILLLLLSFAPYAGVGIKTALGMGAVSVSLCYGRKEGKEHGWS